MHDWWVALVAAALGEIDFVAEPLVLYRQHGTNVAGAERHSAVALLKWLMSSPRATWRHGTSALRRNQVQAAALLHAHESRMTTSVRRVVRRYATLSQRNFVARRVDVLRFGYRFNRPSFNAALLLFV